MRYIFVYISVCFCIYVHSADIQNNLYNLYMGLEELNVYTPGNTLSQEFDILLRNPRPIAARNHNIYNRLYSILHPDAKHADEYLTSDDKKIVPLGKPYFTLSNDQKKRLQDRAQEVANAQWDQFPLSCFYECDSQTCVLSRSRNPEYRDVYDRSVADHIVQAWNEHNPNPVHYLSIGSGGLLEELRILGLAFKQAPNLKIVVHCVDPWFQYPSAFDPIQLFPVPVFAYNEVDVKNAPFPQPKYFLYVLQDRYRIGVDTVSKKVLSKAVAQHASPKIPLQPGKNIRLYTYSYIGNYKEGVAPQEGAPLFPYPHVIASADLESQEVLDETKPLIEGNESTKAIYLLKKGESIMLTILSQSESQKLDKINTLTLYQENLNKYQQEKARLYGE